MTPVRARAHATPPWRDLALAAVLASLIAIRIPGPGTPLLFAFGLLCIAFLGPLIASRREYQPWILLFLAGVGGASVAIIVNGAAVSSIPTSQPFRLLVYTGALVAWKTIWRCTWQSMTAGIAIGIGALWLQTANTGSPEATWKYALAFPVCLMVLLFVDSTKRGSLLAGFCVATLAITALFFAHRTMALILIAALVIWSVARRRQQLSRTALFLCAGAFLAIAQVLISSVPQLAEDGALGATLQRSFAQNQERSSNVILGGRSELPVSLSAALESPVLGSGMTPQADTDILNRATGFAQELGVAVNDATLRTWINPSSGAVSAHSAIMEFWIVGGALGLIVGIVMVIAFARALRPNRSLITGSLGFTFLLTCSLWDLFFSPYLTGRDLVLAFAVCLVGASVSQDRKAESEPRASGPDFPTPHEPLRSTFV
ncbi:O-antigen ligase family protein [Microbacterium imperiale]|uniref:O-antigen ligase n=1 Tax=Microbacterium imperiale TaxID=33884 RepID=A0A9W6HHK1_9MICO|nr:hypothetical protein [Microbacterium imperiale]MBP2420528.1 putative membrane protein YqjE [Microbacterium imperiale]MDS0200350.1 hypothetical protein [Microbacterium imperiale]BFE40869.1 hypothetical protein GCM10017544_18250 [Microbacterium imperiale]GLJ79958.1 hypothetical protein GCM10017586_16410 [Microbacterium imperiale]